MEPVSLDELLGALDDAHDGMAHEYMSCPWCTGMIENGEENHDEFCIWPRIEEQIKEMKN